MTGTLDELVFFRPLYYGLEIYFPNINLKWLSELIKI